MPRIQTIPKTKPVKPKTLIEVLVNPTHNLHVEYWSDDNDKWTAKLTWTETRQGRQYGGAVVHIIEHKGTLKGFWKKVCKHVQPEILIHWAYC